MPTSRPTAELPALLKPKDEPIPVYDVEWLVLPYDFQSIVTAYEEWQRQLEFYSTPVE